MKTIHPRAIPGDDDRNPNKHKPVLLHVHDDGRECITLFGSLNNPLASDIVELVRITQNTDVVDSRGGIPTQTLTEFLPWERGTVRRYCNKAIERDQLVEITDIGPKKPRRAFKIPDEDEDGQEEQETDTPKREYFA